MDRILEILIFIVQKNYIAVLIFLAATGAVVAGGMFYVYPGTQNILELRNDIEEKQKELADVENKLAAQEKEKQAKANKKVEKVPVIIYKPLKNDTPIENSSVDLVTSVIQKLERAKLDIVDITYKIDEKNAHMPSNISTILLSLTLNGSYVAFQDFLYELYDDKYLSSVKTIKMTPLKENKTILEINTEIALYVER